MLIVMVWCRGGSTAAHMNITRTEIASVWTAAQLAEAKAKGGYKYIEKLEATWNEQRLYIDKALAVLGTSALATTIRKEWFPVFSSRRRARSLARRRFGPRRPGSGRRRASASDGRSGREGSTRRRDRSPRRTTTRRVE